jgi:hypothetical protein
VIFFQSAYLGKHTYSLVLIKYPLRSRISFVYNFLLKQKGSLFRRFVWRKVVVAWRGVVEVYIYLSFLGSRERGVKLVRLYV